MAKLSELTDPTAVDEAIQEFKHLGRDQFLLHYKLEGSRDYFVEFDGALIDTKPIVAVAYRNQHPDHGLLSPKEFSGGTSGAAKRLETLGYTVVTRAQLSPPQPGASFPSRTAIYEQFGGEKVAGIMRFPGEAVVNVYSDATGPYADAEPSLTEMFGYRGEGLRGPQQLKQRGNGLLEAARTAKAAVRFWHRPKNSDFTFLAWTAVVGREWLIGPDVEGALRPEVEWKLQVVPGQELGAWSKDVQEAVQESSAVVDDEIEPPEAKVAPTYEELLARVAHFGQPRRKSGVVRANFARSAAVKRAVLLRSAGKCESPYCTGMPAEVSRTGAAILDVDHILDLGLKGEDHPLNMVALCPNCHAVKTRGAKTQHWRSELKKIAALAHAKQLAASKSE